MKNLATVQRVLKISEHPNADALELATVLGWQVCVKKGEFAEGDLCVFVAIDTLLPIRDWSRFLEDKHKPGRPARVRTIKLRGELSQGICFPLEILGAGVSRGEGDDVTGELGVEKYEKPIPVSLGGEVAGAFPKLVISVTDEERIQNVAAAVGELQGLEVYVSVKMDGTSSTFIKEGGELRVCGRNWEYRDDPASLYWRVARRYDLANVLPDGYSIQGEICGPKIQGNKMGLPGPEPELFVFNVQDNRRRVFLGHPDFVAFIRGAGLTPVPEYYVGPMKWAGVPELLEEANGVTYANGKRAEGLVVRPVEERYSEALNGRLSFKVVSNRFLLQHKE